MDLLPLEKQSKQRKCKAEDDETRSGIIECLPREIALDILSRLPITSILRSRFVSQAWNELSRDPNLVDLHFSWAARNDPCLILHCDFPIRNQLHFVELHEHEHEQIPSARKIHAPFLNVMPEFTVIASCNGLLCLYDSLHNDPLYIYNPFTQEYKELPRSRQFDDQEVVFGFGFHPTTGEYKVIKIIRYWNRYNANLSPSRSSRRLRIHHQARSEVQVHSLSSSTWRCLGEAPYCLGQQSSEALVNGRLHWLTRIRRSSGPMAPVIVSFDLADEQFREVPGPDCCKGLKIRWYCLAVLGGCLSSVALCLTGLEVWVMEEYDVSGSWIKRYNIVCRPPLWLNPEFEQLYGVWENMIPCAESCRVLCLLRNGNILIESKGGGLFTYDPDSGITEKLMFRGVPNLFRTFVHMGSLGWIDSFDLYKGKLDYFVA